MTPTPPPTAPGRGTRVRDRAIGIAAATVAAVLVWVVAVPVLGVVLEAEAQPGAPAMVIGVVPVIIVPVFIGLLGWGLLALLERFTARARTVWTVIAVVVLLLSLLGVIGGTTLGAQLTLGLLHLVVGAVIIVTFARTARAA